MRVADWLTYTDLEHLRRLQDYYDEQTRVDLHSKHELIRLLLRRLSDEKQLGRIYDRSSAEEKAFLELLLFDEATTFTLEELMAKASLAQANKDCAPRKLLVQVLKKGWLFPGYSADTRDLYYVPSDLRERLLKLIIEPVLPEPRLRPPTVYRNEEGQLVNDLVIFLQFLQKDLVRLTQDGAIYKQQQKRLFQSMVILEEPITGKGPRFGFGRSYHLYPDRFALLYDYAYYQGYFSEESQQSLRLTPKGEGKIRETTLKDGEQLYQFWIRLYRRPIPQLPVILRWISIFADIGWSRLNIVYKIVRRWLAPYYYESQESLFQRVIQMLLHLGVIQVGSVGDDQYLTSTTHGKRWMKRHSAFRLQVIEEGFTQQRPIQSIID